MHHDEYCNDALSRGPVELNILVVLHSDDHKLHPTRNGSYHDSHVIQWNPFVDFLDQIKIQKLGL
jgi:hypothetical protein